MGVIADKYRTFRAWQRRPYTVAPLSTEEHDCPTCATHYQGNYCPRCGQSSRIGRYSFKKAFLLFIDVWGIGNRGMFRSLRDLILRPGYMIRDYLGGMQMAYFPPFKMLFLLTTVSILVNVYGINIRGEVTTRSQSREEVSLELELQQQQETDPAGKDFTEKFGNAVLWYLDKAEQYPSAVTLGYVVVVTLFFYLFFRKSKVMSVLTFPEFLIAMVFTANMLSIYEILTQLLCLKSDTVNLLLPLTAAIPLKQLSGFSWLRTLLSMLTAVFLLAFTATAAMVAYGIIVIGLGQ